MTPSITVSPTITRWEKLTDAALMDTVRAFWNSNPALPLVELDPDYDKYLYITLIYKGAPDEADVSFDLFGNYDDPRLGDKKLKQLRHTGLYYRSYYMPADICFSYRFLIHNRQADTTVTRPDAFNPNRIPYGAARPFSWSVLDLRPSERDSLNKIQPGAKGRVQDTVVGSKILGNSRQLHIYIPDGYSRDRKMACPVIFLFDSFIYLNRIEVPNVLDNLIRQGLTGPVVAVMIDNPTSTSRNFELPLNFAFKDFIISELVPWVEANYNVARDPSQRIIGGMSYGGLAAGFIAFYHDTVFGNVLSQSGSFWRDTAVEDASYEWHRYDWLTAKYAGADRKALRLWLDWGLQEPVILNSNRKLVRILNKKGYDFRFAEFNGWHDWSNSRKTFAEGILYLLNK